MPLERYPIEASTRRQSGTLSTPEAQKTMGFEDDLRRIDEHIADARRMVHQQKGLIIRLLGAGVSTWDAQIYFGCWNPTYGDWRNTGTAFGHASMFSKQSDARHCRDTSSVPAAEGHYLSASLAASMPACAQVSPYFTPLLADRADDTALRPRVIR